VDSRRRVAETKIGEAKIEDSLNLTSTGRPFAPFGLSCIEEQPRLTHGRAKDGEEVTVPQKTSSFRKHDPLQYFTDLKTRPKLNRIGGSQALLKHE
jgi:hypothetical protein